MDIFKMLYKSFGSVDAYRKAVSFWQWKALLYFFLLAARSGIDTRGGVYDGVFMG